MKERVKLGSLKCIQKPGTESLSVKKNSKKVNQSHFGPSCPEGSRKLRFPDSVTVAQDGG